MPTPPSLIEFRHELHRRPETAGQERETAERIKNYFADHHPDFSVEEGVGGHGLLLSKHYGPGPEVAFRAELDGLPIRESSDAPHRSEVEGRSHVCGHDGHMTILLDTVRKIEEIGPSRGALHLIFQPAEETGHGARAMLESGRLDGFHPDMIYALHNIPGRPMGQVLGVDANFACGSVGAKIDIEGQTAHAAHPEDAVNPLIIAVTVLDDVLSLIDDKRLKGYALATPIGLVSGDETFGTSPKEAKLMVTLRAVKKDDLQYLMDATQDIVRRHDEQSRATLDLDWVDFFPVTKNPPLTDRLREACRRAGVDFAPLDNPFRWSEDFGNFQRNFRAYMFGLGSGEEQPPLHSAEFDFPDELIDVGSSVFLELFKDHTGE